jgi:hypothetical protein
MVVLTAIGICIIACTWLGWHGFANFLLFMALLAYLTVMYSEISFILSRKNIAITDEQV